MKFAYCFPIDGKIVWSGETNRSLAARADNEDDLSEINEFVISSKVGEFITLTTGELIFRTE